ncbi:hypothetical protein diail_2142 [Diaporthe ilicicola]|nr:hypothetical protein diail_2142 [Diaporthe ilicicola]
MRLLETATLQLVSKRDDEIPPYAVLSHTWGRDEDEVSLQDLQSQDPFKKRRVKKKAGYPKLRDSAKVALEKGYEYIWIDTCCIDKTSSAELSEAINSMFRWYQESGICLAYLVDVTVGSAKAPGGGLALGSSRWFTRGWTLQELIAPQDVLFYNYEWKLLGSRVSDLKFRLHLGQITGISDSILSGQQGLETVSVADRMKWASARHTTRREDLAYCLLGIFGVNMPLLYGEGSRAFIRLQEEIIKGTNDQSIFAWTLPEDEVTHSSSLLGLLAPSPNCFQYPGWILPLPPNEESESAPSTMTNVGLHVQLTLTARASWPPLMDQLGVEHSDGGDILAVLDCMPHRHDANDDSGYDYDLLAIEMTRLGGDQYARTGSNRILTVHSYTLGEYSLTLTPQYLYVKQAPTHILPEIIVRADLPLVDVFPYTRWNKSTRTLKTASPQPEQESWQAAGSGLQGVFRFEINLGEIKGRYHVDVSVMLQKGKKSGTASWDFKCLQRRARQGESLQKVFALSRYEKPSDEQDENCTARVFVSYRHNRPYLNLYVVPWMAELSTSGEIDHVREETTERRSWSWASGAHTSIIRNADQQRPADTEPSAVVKAEIQRMFVSFDRGQQLGFDQFYEDEWKGEASQISSPETPLTAIPPLELPSLLGSLPEEDHTTAASKPRARTPVHIATIENNIEELKRLVAPDNKLFPVVGGLKDFAETSNPELMLQAANEYGMTWTEWGPGVLDEKKRTPLWYAAAMGRLDAASILIQCGTKTGVRDNSGRSDLHMACLEGHHEMVRLLLQSGVDAEQPTQSTPILTPMHFAAFSGSVESVRLLIHHGASPQFLTDDFGPLHIAAANGWINCVEMLCRRGWDPDLGSFGVVREEEGRPPSVTHDRAKPMTVFEVAATDVRVRLRKYIIALWQDMPIVVQDPPHIES